MEKQEGQAGGTVWETTGRKLLEFKQVCFVMKQLRARDEAEPGRRQVFVFRGLL
jgi:hypothetical protein